ncbi:MAG: hypothetical protein AAB263_01920 [Planctomycetota bacterium]
MLKLQAILGPSVRLRDVALKELLSTWTGSVRRSTEPTDLRSILIDIDTPSFLGEPTLWIIRAGENWIKQQVETLATLVGKDISVGAIVLVAEKIDGRTPLSKALAGAKAVIHAVPPWSGLKWGEETTACKMWIGEQLARHPGGVQRTMLCADQLYGHCGHDADQLLAAVDVLSIYADEGPITPEAVEAVVSGQAERPAWEFSAAVLAGDAEKAFRILHAGQGMEPGLALAMLTAEVRKLLACLESEDDRVVAEWLGNKNKPNLRQARRQAESLGRATLQRLMSGIMRAQRQLRTSGTDPELEVTTLVLHARQLLGAGKR